MCDPVIGLSFAQAAIGVGSAYAQQQGQKRAFIQNRDAALADFRERIVAIQDRRDQENRSVSEDAFDLQIAALQERARANVDASMTGMADVSANEVLSAISGRASRALDQLSFNRDSINRQLDREAASAGAQANSRINSVARPSMTAMGFDMANAVLSGGGTYMRYRNINPGG